MRTLRYAIYDNAKEPVATARGENELRKSVVELNGEPFNPFVSAHNEFGQLLAGDGQNYSFKIIGRREARKIERDLAKEAEEAQPYYAHFKDGKVVDISQDFTKEELDSGNIIKLIGNKERAMELKECLVKRTSKKKGKISIIDLVHSDVRRYNSKIEDFYNKWCKN